MARKLKTKKNKYHSASRRWLPLAMMLFLFFIPNLSQAQLTFQHWQTFRQTKAFYPLLHLDKSLDFKYKPNQSTNRFELKNADTFSSFAQQQIPGYLDIHPLGWFCTLDLRMDLSLPMPFRFRLGSLEDVNRKEGYYD